jgi:3-hydroxyacyl-CoA dehydrogenase/enoyl-CoA hydratase/3-hydroxybutyryl-CoA epimerase
VASKKKVVDETVYTLLPGGGKRVSIDASEIADRVALSMVTEAIRCLEGGVLRSPRDGDVGAIFGLGFPPFRGGPFRYVDVTGADAVLRRLEDFRRRFGERFAPPPLLQKMASEGKRFYPNA